MIEMHSKYDKMHKNGMFYALICINNHIFACLDCMLLVSAKKHHIVVMFVITCYLYLKLHDY